VTASKSPRHHPFEMSLRLWSDTLPLASPTERLRLPRSHLHIKGEHVALEGPLAKIIARRHYASVAVASGVNGTDVDAWLLSTSVAIESVPAIIEGLRKHEIEGVFWIAMFGSEPLPAPNIRSNIIERIAALGAKILIENYTDLSPLDGNPEKIWLPTQM
jgi:hypothetical protein